ncbi:MAG: hypothetical protein IKN45_00840, partial [Lachnospiraceae bacterium]|nr:hypothetical protein [Lachnospiraceae bacterium]
MKKIIIDLEGSDNGAEELLKGALKASEEFPELAFVLSVTEPERFSDLLSGINSSENKGAVPKNIEILTASDIIRTDEPAMCIFKGR